jgi:hypothetical protein
MWARWTEVVIALWLALSPWVFRGSWISPWPPYADEMAVAVVLIGALASFRHPTRHAHLLSVVVAIWLILFGWIRGDYPADPASQNRVLTGIVLLMFAILPNHATQPPYAWRVEQADIADGDG